MGLRRFSFHCLTVVAAGVAAVVFYTSAAMSQSSRKPIRVAAPVFRPGQFDGIFFDDPARQLTGELPKKGQSRSQSAGGPAAAGSVPAVSANDTTANDDGFAWKEVIAPNSLEDLIKAGKLRLDKIITTPTAFKGGGFAEARVEFSLQALLFAIIESYPSEVRWKNSATSARQLFTRVAANTKIGSDQVYAEAKARLLDLNDLIGGTPLAASKADATGEDINWSHLIDRVPLMLLLEWAHEQNLSKMVASEAEFKGNGDAVQRYAELVAVLGKISLAEEMPDAMDADYRAFAQTMVAQAQQVVLAVKTGNSELARSSAAQIGQACSNCHDNFR